jgi:RHS repeat-associated protein
MTNGYTGSFAGIVTSNTYNDRLQPIVLSAAVGSNSIFSLCYDFHLGVPVTACNLGAYTTGNNGNVFQVLNNVDSTRSAAYIYDPLNRIAQAYTVNTNSANCWGETYSPTATAPGVLPSTPGIDAWSNLINRSGVTGMSGNCTTEGLSATATTLNQLSGIGMLYDVAGNVTTDNLGNTYTYDAENRITAVAGYTYFYDADGTRMEKTNGSSGTMYWPGPSGTLTETDLTGTINEEYVYFNGQRIARVDRPSGTVHYYFSNHLGSHTMVTSATGGCEQDVDYFPYGGEITDHCPNVAQHYKFTGKERDSESGLDMFGARYYGSTLGRFMIPDWAAKPTAVPYAMFGNPQSLNLYSYVNNNPTTARDPDGHCFWDACVLEGTAVYYAGAAVLTAAAVLSTPQGRAAVTDLANRIGSAITSLYPSNSGQNAPPPPTTPTNVPQGTPGTTATNVPQGTPGLMR